MTNSFDFDVVVIGAGPGGYVAAIRASQLGLKTACIEKDSTLGGTCLNVGCIPSKALLEISHKYHDAEHQFANIGINAKGLSLDIAKVLENKNQIISGLTNGIAGLLKKNKVTHIQGLAKFINKNQVEITSKTESKIISAKNFVIATGSQVISLPNVVIDEKVIVSSTGALELSAVPKKMVVIGAGVIGLELGSVWSRFGAEVEVIEYLDRITPNLDAEISRNFQKILEKQNIKFRLATKVLAVNKKKSGNKEVAEIEIADANGDNPSKMTADVVLVAVGRKPNTANLGLEDIGVILDKRGFVENNHLKTNIENIWAIGDVTTGPMLAHKAEDEGVAVAEMIAGQKPHINYSVIPNVVYTYPEVASVGATEEELKAGKIEYKVGKFSMMANSRARATFDDQGLVKVLACAKTDRLLGVHIVAREAGNMIHEAVVAMEFGGSAEDLARTCHAHPTYNEAIKEACLAVDKRAIHS
jgi:dihydrolipoamide dehydrogenase